MSYKQSDLSALFMEGMKSFRADEIAMFVDFDGTLVAFKDVPEEVRLPAETAKDIEILNSKLRGAFAIITGRDHRYINDIALPAIPVAASYGHGSYTRNQFNGEIIPSVGPIDESRLDTLLGKITLPEGVWIESKHGARALHWNKSEQPSFVEPLVRTSVEGIILQYNDGLPEEEHVKYEKGRMVYEIGSTRASKGKAIAHFMNLEPFKGRTAVYFGDQPADESAMKEINRIGGISIGVGPDAPKIAKYRLSNPNDVQKALSFLAKTL